MSVLSTEASLFIKPFSDQKTNADDDSAHIPSRFRDKDGDQLTMLNVFCAFHKTSHKERHAFCKKHRLNKRALKQAENINAQLRDAAAAQGLSLRSSENNTIPIRRALTAGYFKHAAQQQRDRCFKTIAGNRVANLHPSSALFDVSPRYVAQNSMHMCS